MSDLGPLPEASVDEVDRAPGGVDASPNESDVGAGADHEPGEVLTPDQPLSAQTDQAQVPDELQRGEDTEPENEATSAEEDPGDGPAPAEDGEPTG